MGIKCWFDGGCGPRNPGGHATYGAVVRDESDTRIFVANGYLGEGPQMSNNVAEYAGICAVMEFLIESKIQQAVIFGDSKLVVKQLNRQWKARGGLYLEQYKRAILLRDQLPHVVIKWIPRERNLEADSLCQKAMPKRGLNNLARNSELIRLVKEQRADQRETERRTMMDKIFE
jgi:ribonuclease HI